MNASLLVRLTNCLTALEIYRAALDHEGHKDGECGCCWTVNAEAFLRRLP